MNLDFDKTTHRYIVDGHYVPSVTQIVAPLGEDYDEPDELTENVIDAAAERGTIMHEYIAHRLNGGAREDFELPEEYAEYADGVELFLDEHDIEPYAIETPITDGAYAGTPDLVCGFDEELCILDYKFVSSVSKSKVCAQLGGYLQLCEYNDIYPLSLIAVQFRRGDYRLYETDVLSATKMWQAAAKLYEYKTMKHPRGRIGDAK